MVPLEGARGRVGMEGEPGIPSDRGLRMKLARPREEPIVRRRVVGGGGQADSPTTTTLLRLRRNVVRVVARSFVCASLSLLALVLMGAAAGSAQASGRAANGSRIDAGWTDGRNLTAL